jgi:hypothetical protein
LNELHWSGDIVKMQSEELTFINEGNKSLCVK